MGFLSPNFDSETHRRFVHVIDKQYTLLSGGFWFAGKTKRIIEIFLLSRLEQKELKRDQGSRYCIVCNQNRKFPDQKSGVNPQLVVDGDRPYTAQHMLGLSFLLFFPGIQNNESGSREIGWRP